MSDMNLDEIQAAALLNDIRKKRVALPNRKPATRRTRSGSESDVIDSACEPEVADEDLAVEEAEEAEEAEEDETPTLRSPKSVIPPRNAIQTQLFKDLSSVLKNRKQTKSNPNIAESEFEAKEATPKPQLIVNEDEQTPTVHNPIKMPGLLKDLKRNIRERPKTMDLGDLHVIKSLSSKKSPAPAIPKIIEAEPTEVKEKVKDVTKPEVKATIIKQDMPTKDLQDAKSLDITQKVLSPTASKSIEQSLGAEKKTIVESKMVVVDNKISKESTKIATQTTTQKSLNDTTLRSNIQSVNKIIEVSRAEKVEMIGKSYNKISDVKTTNVENVEDKLNLHKGSKTMETKLKETVVINNSIVVKKSTEPGSSIKQIVSTKLVESKTLPQSQVKEKPAEDTPASIKSTEVANSQTTPTADNFQKKATPAKELDSIPTPVSPLKSMNATSNDKIIKTTTDKLSRIKSINPHVTNSSHLISETNIVSEKSKSIDKSINNPSANVIKPTEIVDNKAVRELTNNLMEESYNIYRKNKNQNVVNIKSKNIIPVDQLAETKESSRFTKAKESSENKEFKNETNTRTTALIREENKGRDFDKFKNVEITKLSKDSLNSKINAGADSPSETNKKELILNKFAPPISDPKKVISPMLTNQVQKEHISATNKIEPSFKTSSTINTKSTSNITSPKSTAQEVKSVLTAQKSAPQLLSESAKEDVSKNKLTKSESIESTFKNRTTWMKNSTIEKTSQEAVTVKPIETNTKITDSKLKQSSEGDRKHNEASLTENVNNKSAALNSTKVIVDEQTSLGTNKLTARIQNFNATDKKVDANHIRKSIEKSENSTNSLASDKLGRKIELKIEHGNNLIGKSVSKENLSISQQPASVPPIKFEGKSTKDESKSSTDSGIVEPPAHTKTEILITNFRLRNNITSNISKETSTTMENLKTSEDKPIIPKTDLQKNIKEVNTTNLNVSSTDAKTTNAAKEGLDPFRANRRNNIFRQQSSEQTAKPETTISEDKSKNAKNVEVTTPQTDITVNIRSTWRRLSNTISSLEEKEVKLNVAPTGNISQLSKDPKGPVNKQKYENANLEDVTKSAKDITIKYSSTKLSAFRSPNTNSARVENSANVTKASNDVIVRDNSTTITPIQITPSKSTVPQSFPIKKEVSISSTETNPKVTANSGDVPKSSAVTRIRNDSIKALDNTSKSNHNITQSSEVKKDASISEPDKSDSKEFFTKSAFRKSLTYNDLLKKSLGKVIPIEIESKTQVANKSDDTISSTAKKTDIQSVVNNSSKSNDSNPIVENKWRRPVTLTLRKEEAKADADKPSITSISSATAFLQGNKLSKMMFENKVAPSVTNTNLKSTGSATPSQESEPSTKQNINTSPTKSTESLSSPTISDKVSPAIKHESPTFNKMFMPKSTFRSPSSIINKSTEDISNAIRGTNSFRQIRPQTLTGNEHIPVQRTVSSASKWKLPEKTK